MVVFQVEYTTADLNYWMFILIGYPTKINVRYTIHFTHSWKENSEIQGMNYHVNCKQPHPEIELWSQSRGLALLGDLF